MPKFNKSAEELETKFDKWLYVLRNLHKLDRIPEKFKENIFLKLFETAEIARFNQLEYQEYEDSLKYYRDIKNSLDTAREEGERKKQMEIAKTGLKEGLSIELIMKLTGLSKEEIENLKE
jgi:predicted transposase/invertase (TIGR01784 family)